MQRRSIVVALSAPAFLAMGPPASAQSTHPTAHPAQTPRPHGILLIALTTGLEDIQVMNMALRQARVAADQHRLEEVVLLVYGRGVQAFDGGIPARPPQTAQLAREAMTAGVRVLVCGNALAQMGLDRARLDPAPTEVVPQAIVTLTEYAARGATLVRY